MRGTRDRKQKNDHTNGETVSIVLECIARWAFKFIAEVGETDKAKKKWEWAREAEARIDIRNREMYEAGGAKVK